MRVHRVFVHPAIFIAKYYYIMPPVTCYSVCVFVSFENRLHYSDKKTCTMFIQIRIDKKVVILGICLRYTSQPRDTSFSSLGL